MVGLSVLNNGWICKRFEALSPLHNFRKKEKKKKRNLRKRNILENKKKTASIDV